MARFQMLSFAALTCAGLALAIPQSAHARPPRPEGYVLLTPASIYFPVGDDDFADTTEPGYGWGVGGGVVLPTRTPFTVALGLGIDHQILNWDRDIEDAAEIIGCTPRGSLLHIVPEARIGGRNRIVFGYGIVGMGLVAAIYNNNDCTRDILRQVFEDRTDLGLNLKIGGGAQFYFAKHFGLGFEATGQLGYLSGDNDDYGAHTFDMRVLAAFRF